MVTARSTTSFGLQARPLPDRLGTKYWGPPGLVVRCGLSNLLREAEPAIDRACRDVVVGGDHVHNSRHGRSRSRVGTAGAASRVWCVLAVTHTCTLSLYIYISLSLVLSFLFSLSLSLSLSLYLSCWSLSISLAFFLSFFHLILSPQTHARTHTHMGACLHTGRHTQTLRCASKHQCMKHEASQTVGHCKLLLEELLNCFYQSKVVIFCTPGKMEGCSERQITPQNTPLAHPLIPKNGLGLKKANQPSKHCHLHRF